VPKRRGQGQKGGGKLAGVKGKCKNVMGGEGGYHAWKDLKGGKWGCCIRCRGRQEKEEDKGGGFNEHGGKGYGRSKGGEKKREKSFLDVSKNKGVESVGCSFNHLFPLSKENSKTKS